MQTKTSPSERCPTCGRKHKRRNPQNAVYWLLLHKMAERDWCKQKFSAEQFHIYYKTRFLGCDDVTLPNGKTLTIPRSSADLDVTEFSAYFDAVQADAAERGVWLDE
jgi:hypothetical protein